VKKREQLNRTSQGGHTQWFHAAQAGKGSGGGAEEMKALFLAAQEHDFVEYPQGEKKKKSQSKCGKYENFF
jgi:hypothetical protein